MKVLQVGLSYNPGGIENFVMTYYRALARHGVQFDFVCGYDRLAFQEEIEALGGRVFFLPNSKRHPVKFIREYKALLLREKYDIVHVNMLTAANILPLSIAYKAGVPRVIAHSHNSDTEFWHKKLLHFLNKNKIGKYATDFFACGQAAAEWLFPKKIIASGSYKIVNNALRLSEFQYDFTGRIKYRESLGLAPESFVICHIGRMEPQKNQSFLIDVFYQVNMRFPDAYLLLVGDGYQMQEVKQKVEQLGLSERVRFLGRRRDIPSLLNASDAFCLPSLFEGFGIVAVEAQAAGLPCLVSDTVPAETKFSEHYVQFSLKSGPEQWAEQLLAFRSVIRDEKSVAVAQENIRNRGFDIESGIRLYE